MKIVLSAFLCALVSAGEVDEKYQRYSIVPQVIPDTPRDVLEIVYPSNAKVSLGDELTPTAVKDQPRVVWTPEPDAKYTLIMSDPDAASMKGFLHWLVVDITGTDISTGRSIADYIGSGPPLGTGIHRYLFTVFKQPSEVNFTEPYTPNDVVVGRIGFNEQRFSEKYNLGKPLAGNFYRAQYDDYVPILHSRFMKATTPTPAIVSVRSVPEYVTSRPAIDIHVPIKYATKTGFVSDDQQIQSKVVNEADLTTAASVETTSDGTSDSTKPIPHDNLTKVTSVDNDTQVHTKVESVDHLGGDRSRVLQVDGESSDDELATRDTPVPHHGVIIGAYMLNDSPLHTKVLSEEEILNHKTDPLDTTEPTIPHHGLVKAAFVSEDSVIHSQVLSADQLKAKDSIADASEPTEGSTSAIHSTDGTPAYTSLPSESTSSVPVELSTNLDALQSTERSAIVESNEKYEALVTVVPIVLETENPLEDKAKDSSESQEASSTTVSSESDSLSTRSDSGSTLNDSDVTSTTPTTYEIKTTISVSSGNVSTDKVEPVTYPAQVFTV